MKYKQLILDSTPDDAEVFFLDPKFDTIHAGQDVLEIPEGHEAYFVDLRPNTDWSHPCAYILVSPDGLLHRREHTSPPSAPDGSELETNSPIDHYMQWVPREAPRMAFLEKLWTHFGGNIPARAKLSWYPFQGKVQSAKGRAPAATVPQGGELYFIDLHPTEKWPHSCAFITFNPNGDGTYSASQHPVHISLQKYGVPLPYRHMTLHLYVEGRHSIWCNAESELLEAASDTLQEAIRRKIRVGDVLPIRARPGGIHVGNLWIDRNDVSTPDKKNNK